MFKKVNQRAKNLSLMDVKLIQLSTLFSGILLVKLFPSLLRISYLVLSVLLLICLVKPFYSFWIKK